MGASKVSARESYLDSPMQKGEFPKLKTSELVKPERIQTVPVVQPEEPKEKPPVFFWLSLAMVILQVLLFLGTLWIVKGTQRTGFTTALLLPKSKPAKESAHASHLKEVSGDVTEAPVAQATNAVNTVSSYPKGELEPLVADFDRPEFKTAYNTRFHVDSSEYSRKSLRLSFDSVNRFGKDGNALRIDYSFASNQTEPADFLFEVPELSISKYKEFTFQLRAIPAEGARSSNLSVILVGVTGREIAFKIGTTFSFWKKYELELDPSALETIGEGIKTIKFEINPTGDSLTGTWYLDNLTFV